jgi:hypothetical protein
MPNAPVTTLDHVDQIVVPGRVFEKPVNEFWTLICFWQGMEFLYRQANKCDEAATKILNPEGKHQTSCSASFPALDGLPKALLSCSFHWYAVTACQYVRTVGVIAKKTIDRQEEPLAYVERIIPELKTYRDKVAAHLSWSTQNTKDNDAERLASVIPSLSFENDGFYIASYTVGLSGSKGGCTSAAIQRWSICRIHEQLRRRYWPEEV